MIEAPRGTLFHDYSTDENGLLTRVNLIVATGNNNWAMHTASGLVAKAFVDGNKLTEGMLNRVEAAIRCYDPVPVLRHPRHRARCRWKLP